MGAKSLQSCLTLCDLRDCSPPGSSVHGILQARKLEWVVKLSSRGPSPPGYRNGPSDVSCTGKWFFFFFFLPLASPGKPPKCANHSKISNLSWGQGPSTCVVCSGRHVEDTQEILGGKKEREGAGEGEERMEGRREERRKGRRAKPPKWTPQLLSPAGSSVRTKENQESCMQGHPHPLGN